MMEQDGIPGGSHTLELDGIPGRCRMGSLEGAGWGPWRIPHSRAVTASPPDPSRVLWGWSCVAPKVWAGKLSQHKEVYGRLMFPLHRDETSKGSFP